MTIERKTWIYCDSSYILSILQDKQKWIEMADTDGETYQIRHLCSTCKTEAKPKLTKGERGSERYLDKLVEKKDSWKLVYSPDDWHPSWHTNIGLCFLTFLHLDRCPARVGPDHYYIWCCGVDNFDMAIRMLSKEAAEKIFSQITHGISVEGLEALGLEVGA